MSKNMEPNKKKYTAVTLSNLQYEASATYDSHKKLENKIMNEQPTTKYNNSGTLILASTPLTRKQNNLLKINEQLSRLLGD